MSWLPKKTVVVPVDFSADSANTIAVALELAGATENVHLLHVMFPLETASPAVIWGNIDEKTRKNHVQQEFDKLIMTRNLAGAHVAIEVGDPGLEIADYAERHKADLIVIPSHGYHGVKRVILGSVTERVLRHAKCPVLVLRTHNAE
ncbi:MAG: universal stress protein [Planctomycetota bacterium]|nr:universal stress protein [Planctomycetota bacterium]MDA1213936.1 universal stress protein [Planctomycetota bacterium]